MIAPKKIAVLKALSVYKFLTRAQMARLGIEKYNSAFSKHIRPLLDAGHVGLLDATNYGIGHIYYLRKKGATFIAQDQKLEIGQINYCINKPELSPQTLFHRTGAIDCQIELFLTCEENGVEVLFYDRDIETLGNIKRDNNLVRKTRVPINDRKFLEPDAIFMLDTLKGKKLYCLEFENKDYTKKSYEKAEKHVRALNMKSPSKKYGHDKGHRTLFIYQNLATMESVMKQVHENIADIGSWFLFKSYDDVVDDGQFKGAVYQPGTGKNFFEGWKRADSGITVIFS